MRFFVFCFFSWDLQLLCSHSVTSAPRFFRAVFNLTAFTDFYAEFARPRFSSFCGFRAGAPYKESPRSSNRMIVDLAPLRTLFPRSITFDCRCTKGGRLLILERVLSDWARGGGRRGGGGCFFVKTALPRVKQEGEK